MRRVALALVVGAGIGAVGACGGRPQPSPAWTELQGKRNEITALATQIRQWRHEAGLEVEPDDATVLAMARTTAATAARARSASGPSPSSPAVMAASTFTAAKGMSRSARAGPSLAPKSSSATAMP